MLPQYRLFQQTPAFRSGQDRSLHPTLVRALVSRIVTNKSMKGQLIFTTHNAGLLDGKVFHNDGIWIWSNATLMVVSELFLSWLVSTN